MDSALACCADTLGLIPAIGIFGSSCNIQMIFLPLGLTCFVMEPDTIIGVI